MSEANQAADALASLGLPGMSRSTGKGEVATMSSLHKVAVFLIAVGAQEASNIMKNLSEKEVEEVSIAVAMQRNVTSGVVSAVIEEFHQMMTAREYITSGGLDYARKVLESAWGKKRADDILKRIEAATEVSAWSLLQTVDDAQILSFLTSEHPQTAALIMANLKPPQAASILAQLPEDFQTEVAYRMATMDKTSPEMINEIEVVLREQIGNVFGGDLSSAGGAPAVAEILNATSRSAEKNILDNLKERDEELANEIMGLMFLFEDIIALNDGAIQMILKEVDRKSLALSMKACSEELKDKFFNNMSQNATEMLKDELQYLGPVRVRDVEEAQQAILDVVRTLEEEGEISIGRSGSEEEIIE